MGRRARLVGLATVLAAGAAVGLTVSGIGGSSRPRAAPTPAAGLEALRAYTIVYTGSDGVQVVSLSGDRESRPIAAPAGPPLQTDAGIAFVSSDTLYLLAAPFTEPRRTSLDADGLFPMVWPGTAGVANNVAQNIVRVQYVDLQGKNLIGGSGWELPPGYRPVSQFLATGPGGVLQALDPGPGGRARLGPVIAEHTVWVSGTNSQVVAWLAASGCASNGECPMHISGSDPTSPGGDQTIVPPSGHGGFLPGGALSPDGRFLAGFVTAPGVRPSQVELAIIDTATFKATLIDGSTVSVGKSIPSAQWTPDGDAVFFSGGQGNMHVYQPGATQATTLDTHGSLSFTIAQS